MSDQSILDLIKQLPTMDDDSLQHMLEEVSADPQSFRDHVGLNEASEFLAALLWELKEREIIPEDYFQDPKDYSDPSQKSGGQGSDKSKVDSLFPLEATTRAASPLGNRKQRRAQARLNRRLSKKS